MGKRVECEIEEVTEEGRKAILATCSECEHTTLSFGTGEGSVRRCLALMRDECPNDEENYYVEEQ